MLLFAVAVLGIFGLAIWQATRSRYRKRLRLLEMQHHIQLERERISRDLHDNVGGHISYIISNLNQLGATLEKETTPDKKQQLSRVAQTAKEMMANLREAIWILSKSAIGTEEFSDKLKAFVHRQRQLHPAIMWEVEEHLETCKELSPSQSLHLFRIVQEAVNNAVKHSQSPSIQIQVEGNAEQFAIHIKDKGIGMNKMDNKDGHYGLENMRFRATEIQAVFTIKSEPRQGTEVSVRLGS